MAEQQGREDSVLNYYKQLLALRKSPEWSEVFTYGRFVPVLEDEENIFAYERRGEDRSALVVANFGLSGRVVPLPSGAGENVLLSNLADVKLADGRLELLPGQVAVLG